MRPYRKPEPQEAEPVIIGYYPLRGKAQIPRLLCEYLHIPYLESHFTPEEWSKFKQTTGREWVTKDLPFLKDEEFVVCGASGAIFYLIEKSGRRDLCGRTLADKIKIDSIRSKHDLSKSILGLICSARPTLSADDQKSLAFYWKSKIQPILWDYQNECPREGWYYGYITIMDFVIYELLNLIKSILEEQLKKFKKLMALRERFSAIPEIRNYENSPRALKEYCPVRYFNQFKLEKMKSDKLNVESTEMDLE